MKSDSPLVTIGLPVYNAEATLRSAVQSIIAQTYPKWTLLLMNDGSTDESCKIAKSFGDERIRVVSDGVNKGISARLNQAVSMSEGKYFCRMDADDIAFPDRLERQVAFLESHPKVDVVASSIAVFRDQGNLYGLIPVPESHQDICGKPWKGFHFFHPTWLGKTAWFRAHPYTTRANGAEDQLVLYSAYRESCFAGLPEVLLGYREDGRSFKKMFSRRIAFWRAIAGHAVKSGRWTDACLLSIIQPVKIVADFLNTELGIDRMRNRLDTVDPQTEAVWQELWRNMVRLDDQDDRKGRPSGIDR